jgi:hypothetical protein
MATRSRFDARAQLVLRIRVIGVISELEVMERLGLMSRLVDPSNLTLELTLSPSAASGSVVVFFKLGHYAASR